ncbi:putative Nudix hydrolase NudL [bacterium HR40]|nr:putative Nudix hydrolase NudL [bacterium HR40]
MRVRPIGERPGFREALRRGLGDPRRIDGAVASAEEAGLEGRRLVPAAVLVPIVGHASAPTILLTVRTDHLEHHAGQICFPGGRIEPQDRHPVAAALREAAEETGIDPARVEILGSLPPHDTVTGFRIHPVVGWLEPPVEWHPDPFEVAEVFELPLAVALASASYRRESGGDGAVGRGYWVLMWQGRRIWGATARILRQFASIFEGGEEG